MHSLRLTARRPLHPRKEVLKAMKPAMKVLAMEKLRQDEQPRSEYGGNTQRRMIGFGRNENMPHGTMPGHVRDFPPMSDNYEMNREWPMDRYPLHPPMGAYNGPDMTYGRHEEYPPHMGGYGRYDNAPEARRRRDHRGRFMMDGMGDDDDDDYSPRSMAGNRTRAHHGSSYGDIYAEGMIYAPGAMNRTAGSMHDMSGPVDEWQAREWVKKMDGGEKFTAEIAEQFRNAICPQCEKWEFYTAMNAMYSDHCESMKKLGIDKPETYAHLAKDFLMDKDAGPHKLRKYMMTIPK